MGVQGAGCVRGVGLGVGVQRLAGAQDTGVVATHALLLHALLDLAHAVLDDVVLDTVDQFPARKKRKRGPGLGGGWGKKGYE